MPVCVRMRVRMGGELPILLPVDFWPQRAATKTDPIFARACGILVPQPGIEPASPAVEAWVLNG